MRDVVAVLQPGEMVRRIAEEIEGHLVELGSDGRLIHLQTVELRSGVSESLALVLRDYADDKGIAHLRSLSADALMDLPKWWPPCTCPPPTTSSRSGWPRRLPPPAPAAPAALRDDH